MAGLWERVREDSDQRIHIHLLVAAIKGIASDAWTSNQALDRMNRWLVHANQPELSGQELTDLQAIATQASTGTVEARLEYVVGRLEPAMIAAEISVIGEYPESAWRSDLLIN